MESRKGKFLTDEEGKVKFVEDEHGMWEVVDNPLSPFKRENEVWSTINGNFKVGIDPYQKEKQVEDLFTHGVSVVKISDNGMERVPYPELIEEMKEAAKYYARLDPKTIIKENIKRYISDNIDIVTEVLNDNGYELRKSKIQK